MEEELEEPTLPVAGDVCLALMGRYGRSSAAQHRHLCATAAAMRSLLEEEQLPLTPPSYFAAAIDSLIHNHSELDAVSISALSAFLSVLLPSLPARSLPPGRASDAAFALIGFLRVPPENLMCSASVRSMVGSLGFLISCIDSEDWVAIRRGFNLLLEFAVDKRPKVRRCAQVCIEKNLTYFEKSVIKEKASKAVLSSFNGCLHVACDMNALVIENGSASKGVTCPEHLEVLHMLSAVKALVPVLSRKVIQKILSSVCMFLGPRFSMITRHIHSLIEVIFKHSGNENISFEADKIVHNLSSYVTSIEKKPIDTVMSAMTLLKSALDMLHALDPSTWSKNLPLVFNHIAGFLNSEANISSHAENILKEIISCHIERSTFLVSGIQSLNDNINNSEANSLISICSALENMLGAWNIIPDEHTLAVISDLFLKLGECAHLFMKGIVLKLSKWAVDLNDDVPGKEHLQKCIGSAVIALGPEKMLLLLPITLHSENLTCSNSWLIPILKKYVIGASLQFFMEHVVPLAKSLKKACSEAQKSPKLLELQSSLQGLWGLLPAFCNYTTDTSKSIKSVVSCLIATFNGDPSTHEMISIALQVLVNQNRGVIMAKQKSEEDVVEDCNTEVQAAPSYYSRKIASKNLHALSLNSMDVIQILTEVFFKSPPAKRAYLKETIGCMASIAQKSDTQQFFVSLLENFEPDNIVAEASENHMEKGADKEQDGETIANGHGVAQRSMMIELASCFVEGASEEFINMIFDYIKFSLLDDGLCQFEAYFTLSRIFKEHVWFFHSRFDELRDLLFGAKKPADIMTLRMRLSCYHFLLVHLLKSDEKKMSKKAFLVLNEIIVTLKDSNEEVRKSAYDILIIISGNLKNSMLSNPEQPLQRFFTMIMGYLSGSSPHITSGAVSALSLLIYKNTGVWFSVPELVPSVLALLQSKANEVIKAVLGFAKVLVSCLHAQDLQNFLSAIVNAILPWSSVSKNHFRSKVKIILEIMIRKCGLSSVDFVTPEKYKGFVKSVVEQHQTTSKEAVKHEVGKKQEDASMFKKRKRRESIGSMVVNHPQTSENPKGGRRQNIYQGEISRTKDPEYDSGKGRKSKWTANKDENRRDAYKKPGRVGKEKNTSRNRGTKKFFKPGPASRSAEASSKFQKQKKVGKHMK